MSKAVTAVSDSAFTMRFAVREDAAALLEIYEPFVRETAITFEYDVPTAEQFADRIEKYGSNYPFLVCEEGGRIVGYAYAHRHQERAAYGWSAELSVYVRLGCEGRGIGRLLYSELLRLLRLQGVQSVYAAIALPNDASVEFHRRFGFELVGTWHNTGYKLGEWHDIVWYELALGGHDTPPPSFRSIGEVLG